MTIKKRNAIAAALTVATIAVSFSLASCQGRRMSDMEPKGETVEVSVDTPETVDSIS